MRRVYHRDSGAFEFFPTPEDKLMNQISKENADLKQQLEGMRKQLESLGVSTQSATESELEGLTSDQLKLVCSELGISIGKSSREDTLISKINQSGKSNSEIAEAVTKVKG